ncbi:hypothetical protein K439DRAFT_1621592 [Ramaria rubella]|nr:hypothetical protein K439DRAFT_1621592 [Ramaria rubella]
MGEKLEMEELGSWFYKALSAPPFDREFSNWCGGDIVPGSKSSFRGAEADASNSLPNLEHMLLKQFSKYLECIHDLRPDFEKSESEYSRLPSEIWAGTLRTDKPGGVDMFASTQNSGNASINKFLSQQAKQDLHSSDSKRIERQPHRTASLEYTTTSLLQSYYLHKPIPGHDIAQSQLLAYKNSFRLTKVELVAVGGIIGAQKLTQSPYYRWTSGHKIHPARIGSMERDSSEW